MKRIRLTLMFTLSWVFIWQGLKAQDPMKDPKYGPDEQTRTECIKNLSLYSEFYKQKNYSDALIPWRITQKLCPQSSKNLYIHGITIYKAKINTIKDAALREKYIDSLMMIFDDRIKYQGQEGYVLGRKAIDLIAYREKANQEVYDILVRSIDLTGADAEAPVLNEFMKQTAVLYKNGKLDKEAVVMNYTRASEFITAIVDKAAEKDKESVVTVSNNIDQIFSETGVADCETLTRIFTPKFQQDPENTGLMKNICKLFTRIDCIADVYSQSAEKLYKLEPTAESAHSLARVFLKRQEFSKAAVYYNEAINLQQDSSKKANLYYELGTLTLAQGNPQSAVQYAKNAIKFNAAFGKPYILIGNCYASDAKNIGTDPFTTGAVYWVAVDKFNMAKQVDASLTDEVNNLVTQYSQYFPVKEDGFFYDVKPSDTYTVAGWINEKTVARYFK